jgi:hypothetical protein
MESWVFSEAVATDCVRVQAAAGEVSQSRGAPSTLQLNFPDTRGGFMQLHQQDSSSGGTDGEIFPTAAKRTDENSMHPDVVRAMMDDWSSLIRETNLNLATFCQKWLGPDVGQFTDPSPDAVYTLSI